MEWKDSATKRLHKAYWAASRLWVVPWLLLAGDVSLALLLLKQGQEGGQSLLGWSFVVCLLCSLAWLLYLGWYGPWSRAALWWMVQALERACNWIGRRAAALLLILVSLTLLAGGFAVAGGWLDLSGTEAVGHALSLVFAVMLVAVFHSLYVMRKRVIILPFKTYRAGRPEGSREGAEAGEELASRLRSEIAAIISVYKVIDDVSPTGRAIEATVSVEDTGKDLKEALGPDSRFKLWSIEIPVGALMGLFGWVLRGPRLMGAVYYGENEVLLTAFLSGGRAAGNWRVGSKDLTDEHGWMDLQAPGWRKPVSPDAGADSSALVSELTRQLAYRVVAHVVTTGSPRWEAVYHYTEGLSAYRRTIRTGRERELFLHKAERAFVRALGCDPKFAQCYYNLGIVYRDLGKLEAAESSFRRALQENPASIDAAYAIALSRFNAEKYQEAVLACEHAIRVRPHDARAWKLRGWAKRRELEETSSVPLPADRKEWPEIIRDRAIGAALAWKALCRTREGTDSREAQRWLAAAATLNSGISLCLTRRSTQGDRRLWQAVNLCPAVPVLRFEVGKTWYQTGEWQKALSILEDLPAGVLPPADQPALLLYRLNARFALGGAETEKAQEDYQQLLDRVAAMQPRDWKKLLEDRKAVGELSPGAEDLLSKRRLTPVLAFLEELQRRDDEDLEACRRRLQLQEQKEPDEWRRAQVRVRLAEECLLGIAGGEERVEPDERELARRAQECLEGALATLESGRRFHQIQAQGLRSRLAKAFLILAESEPGMRSFYLTKALRMADRAVSEKPEGAAQRLALGEVYAALQDYLQAEDELTTSLQLDYLGSTAGKLADACWKRGAALRDAQNRKMALSTVSHMLDNALCATEIQSLAGKDAEDRILQHGGIHARLGAFYREGLEESDYDQAIYHQRIAVALGYRPVESRVDLGWTYLQAKDHARADALFHEALVEIERSGAALDRERVRALLGRALLRAERALDLEEAERFARQASAFLDRVEGPPQAEVQALYHRCMGVLRYQTAHRASRSGEPRFENEIDEALRELERAAVLDSSAAVQEWLALAYGVKAEGRDGDRAWWLERARQLTERNPLPGTSGQETGTKLKPANA